MKTKFAVVLAGLAMLAFAGCKSLPSIQQQFQTGCTIVNGDLAILSTSPLLNASQQALIANTILPANEAICKADAGLNVQSLKQFHDSLLPAAIAIVAGIPAIPNQPAVLLGLQTFGPMVQAMIDQIITAAAPAATPAASQ